MTTSRAHNRSSNALRDIEITRNYTCYAPGSVLVCFGNTKVIVSATVEERVPRHIHILKEENRGWLTAEYAMLPGASGNRVQRDRLKISGRTAEIQRLIGRTLRACVDLKNIGARTITIDADVIQADGGTRVAAITGGYVALMDCLAHLKEKELLETMPEVIPVAAVSVGVIGGVPMLDLDYSEDSNADVDANIVMTHDERFIEVQISSEESMFKRSEMDELLNLATQGIQKIAAVQNQALQQVLSPV
ncbi:MAG: ribonuclease PH [Cyanobacteria bacterium P01_H01_bin.74]